MRWRPTLAALGALAVTAVLLVAMSSASSPSVGSPESPAQPAAGTSPQGPDTPGGEPAVAPAAPGGVDPGAANAERLAANSEISAANAGNRPLIYAETGDPFNAGDPFSLLRFLEEEDHQEVTDEEIEELLSIPTDTGFIGEPLGRPARKIRRGPAGDQGQPLLYLTFDDGPSPTWTAPTLDLLDRYGARATFFPVGAYAKLNFHLIEEIAARGHTLGSHLWTHQAAALYDEDRFRQELRASADLLGEYSTNCLRTPYGITNEQIFEWSGDEGFEIVLWGDVDPLDWSDPGIDVLTQRILNGVRPGTILLLHERTGADTLRALDAVLAALSEAGWRFDQPICPLQF